MRPNHRVSFAKVCLPTLPAWLFENTSTAPVSQGSPSCYFGDYIVCTVGATPYTLVYVRNTACTLFPGRPTPEGWRRKRLGSPLMALSSCCCRCLPTNPPASHPHPTESVTQRRCDKSVLYACYIAGQPGLLGLSTAMPSATSREEKDMLLQVLGSRLAGLCDGDLEKRRSRRGPRLAGTHCCKSGVEQCLFHMHMPTKLTLHVICLLSHRTCGSDQD
jgi:hypothetical protein